MKELWTWVRSNLEKVKISDKLLEYILGILYDNYYYIKYEFGYITKIHDNFSKVIFNYIRLDNKYKFYFNENRDLNDYFTLQIKNNRYGIKYE